MAESGYTTPTPIQAQGIPHVLKRRDVIGIAQTGTGKTAVFTLPMIEMLAARPRQGAHAALADPGADARTGRPGGRKLRAATANITSSRMALLIGGVSIDDQDKKLDRGVDVLIATPGRLLDHFERGKLLLSARSTSW